MKDICADMKMECYICMCDGDDIVEDVCSCRDARVHTRCLAEWITRTGQDRCGVCKVHYRGVTWDVAIDDETRFLKTSLLCALLFSTVSILFLNARLAPIVLCGQYGALGVIFFSAVCIFESLWIHGIVQGLSNLPPISRRYLKLDDLYDIALRV